MTGPKADMLQNGFTWVMIIGISSCFFVLAAPFLWHEINWAFVAIIVYLFINTVVFLALTQFTDPGIIPRKDILEKLG